MWPLQGLKLLVDCDHRPCPQAARRIHVLPIPASARAGVHEGNARMPSPLLLGHYDAGGAQPVSQGGRAAAHSPPPHDWLYTWCEVTAHHGAAPHEQHA